jgi:hypothetical protein
LATTSAYRWVAATADRRVHASTTLAIEARQIIGIRELIDVPPQVSPLHLKSPSEPLVVHHYVDLPSFGHDSLNVAATLPPTVVTAEAISQTVNSILESVNDTLLGVRRSAPILKIATEHVACRFEIADKVVYIAARIDIRIPALGEDPRCPSDDTNRKD